MTVPRSKADIKAKYDGMAGRYNLVETPYELLLGIKNLRRQLLQGATGKVLEIAVGTGKNLSHYSKDCEITAVDMSTGMLGVARRHAEGLGRNIAFRTMDAEALAFPDRSFDTVVSSLSLCTFPNPVAAVREMARVCRPEGRILLLEHGRSDHEWLGQWMDHRADKHARRVGCRWNRHPLDIVQQAGLTLIKAKRTFLGIMHQIEAQPS
ncbi:class I SAM-dependent methyltransferase [Candidatus Poribacteria bacterium]|nr:class I SAM-dependent methyltransferase [Candidatus Poribacteria bacterium]